jgi:outer membrane protein assembly factor BamE
VQFRASHLKTSRAARLAALAVLTVSLAACGSVDRTGRAFWQPYRPNVQQGNWITQQQIALLQPGMTRDQVRFALGSPTLTPIFHEDRWEYPYYLKPGYGDIQERRFTVYFENDLLVRWEGDEQPLVQPFQKAPEPGSPEAEALAAQAAPPMAIAPIAPPPATDAPEPDAEPNDETQVRRPNVMRDLQEASARNPAAPAPGGVSPTTGSVPLR